MIRTIAVWGTLLLVSGGSLLGSSEAGIVRSVERAISLTLAINGKAYRGSVRLSPKGHVVVTATLTYRARAPKDAAPAPATGGEWWTEQFDWAINSVVSSKEMPGVQMLSPSDWHLVSRKGPEGGRALLPGESSSVVLDLGPLRPGKYVLVVAPKPPALKAWAGFASPVVRSWQVAFVISPK